MVSDPIDFKYQYYRSWVGCWHQYSCNRLLIHVFPEGICTYETLPLSVAQSQENH
jgi:hypothetical protein